MKEPSINDPQDWAAAAWLQLIAVVLLVVILHVPLGNYMARVYTDSGHWRVERVMYRLIGAQPDNRQRWSNYGFSLLAFSGSASCSCTGCCWRRRDFPNPGDTRG